MLICAISMPFGKKRPETRDQITYFCDIYKGESKYGYKSPSGTFPFINGCRICYLVSGLWSLIPYIGLAQTTLRFVYPPSELSSSQVISVMVFG